MADAKRALAAVRQARKELKKFAKDLPDLDANCIPFAIAMQTAKQLEVCLKDMPPAMKESKQLSKKNPYMVGKTRC